MPERTARVVFRSAPRMNGFLTCSWWIPSCTVKSMTRSGYLFRAALLLALLLSLLLASPSQAQGLEPNDPYWRQSWSQVLLRMPEVWQRTVGSTDIVIATVDTGVDPSIDDLKGQLVPGWDFIANDSTPRDTVGHGTHVASVLAARGNNGIGTAGYCWGCRIMPVRITSDGNATGKQIAQGVYWAVDHGARIITIGLNSGEPDFDQSSAVQYAHDKGVLVIASAGNTGTAALRYPASDQGVVPVAATNDSDLLYFWSTRGSWVRLSAPGCQLVIDRVAGVGTLCGTSFTPAVVAGIAGLMLSLNPSLRPDEIVDALVATSVPVTGINGGRVDPVAALDRVAPPAASQPAGAGAGGGGGAAVPSPKAPQVVRKVSLRNGTLRFRMSQDVRLGKGRLDVFLLAARAGECQISVTSPNGDLLVTALPPGDPELLSLSDTVTRAGKHRIAVDCDFNRRRKFTLEISGVEPGVKPAVPATRAGTAKRAS